MAPPTVPTEVKKRRGTQRADRPGGGASGSLVAVNRAPLDAPPPDTLGEVGRAQWTHALLVCPWIALSDLTILQLLCEAIEQRDELTRALKGSDLLMYSNTGFAYVNPAVAARRKTEEQITKWMQQLGMTPSARGALGVAEVKQASTLDALAARRQERQAGLPGTSRQSPRSPSRTETATTSSSSSTRTDASPRTASPARRALLSPRELGSDDSSERPSPETL